MKKMLPIVIAVIVMGALSFYGGWQYGKNKKASASNLSARMQQFNNGQRRMGAGQNNGFITGEIIAKDEQGLTVKMPDSGSKIIFYSNSTEVVKTVAGATLDLEIGKTITANGTANDDGSITAKSIQIRPATPPKPD